MSAVTVLALAWLTALAGQAPDWSRFRGPNGTGVADTSALPTEFGPARNVVWKHAAAARPFVAGAERVQASS